MYKVIKRFVDLQDGNKVYEVGDVYTNTNEARINELAGSKNKQGQPLIEKVEEPKEEKKPVKKAKKKE